MAATMEPKLALYLRSAEHACTFKVAVRPGKRVEAILRREAPALVFVVAGCGFDVVQVAERLGARVARRVEAPPDERREARGVRRGREGPRVEEAVVAPVRHLSRERRGEGRREDGRGEGLEAAPRVRRAAGRGRRAPK